MPPTRQFYMLLFLNRLQDQPLRLSNRIEIQPVNINHSVAVCPDDFRVYPDIELRRELVVVLPELRCFLM
jgi:hypothetical protein